MDRRSQSSKLVVFRAAGFLVMLALAGCTSLLAPLLKPNVTTELVALKAGDWALDPDHAALIFRINHLGYSDLVGRFETFSVRLTGDPSDPAAARAEAVIDIASLDMANDEFSAQLTGPKWFDAETYPQAMFRTLSVRLRDDANADVDGELTLHGITRPVTLHVLFNGSAFDPIRGTDVAGFSATATINRSDFGISAFSGLVTDEVRIEIEAEFLKQ